MLLLLNINQNDKIWDVNFRLIRVKKNYQQRYKLIPNMNGVIIKHLTCVSDLEIQCPLSHI